MSSLEKEIRANFNKFTNNTSTDASNAAAALVVENEQFVESYTRIVSLQAWRVEILEPRLPSSALSFFLEAQNDALLSHLFARLGLWRPALQALRSVIENVMQSVYYMDHAVELRLWDTGHHRLTFKDLRAYFKGHPDLQGHVGKVAGLDVLEAEYGTLSRAVHASAAAFRMTASTGTPKFFRPDSAELGKWSSRERAVITSLNMFLIALFRDELTGTKALPLRRVLQLSLGPARRLSVKSILGVTLPS